jgi:iron complex transport system ATP-binding protein
VNDTRRDHVLSARDLRFGYDAGQLVLDGVSLQASAGRLLCILGPNGSGKTTLLKCLLGQIRYKGLIELDGLPLHKYARGRLARLLAYVPQIPEVAFAFTVREIVLMGRYAYAGQLGLIGQKDIEVAEAAMAMTETTAFADRSLDALSGGEAQRVMIARALAQQPTVCLLDEPTSHLDIRSQLAIYRMMQRLAHDWKMAVVCVSHDLNMAGRFADEVVLMRGGKVLASGPSGQVLNADALGEAYDVEIDLIQAPGQELPLFRARG